MKHADKSGRICRYVLYSLVPGFMVLIHSSCVSSSSFIQSAETSGPAQKHMIRITENTENESHTLRCQFSENLENEILTSAADVNTITSEGTPEPYYDLKDNLLWKLPKRAFLFDIEFPLSRIVVVFGGINLGIMEDKTSIGKTIGVGFRGTGGDLRMRLDLSLNIQDMDYEVYYVNRTEYIWGGSSEEIIYDHGTLTSKDLGFGITLNTAVQSWLMNPFIHGGIGSQTLIQPKETSFIPDPPSYSDSYLNLAAGLYFKVGGNHRLLIGYGWNKHSNEKGQVPWIANLILQADLVF